MKTLKNTLSILAVLGLVATGVNAQSFGDVEVSATVQAALTVTANQDIALGTIESGEASTIAAGPDDAGSSEANLGVGNQYGDLSVEGDPSLSIDVIFNSTAILTDAADANATNFAVLVFDSASGGAISSGGDVTLSTTGHARFYVGGTLSAVGAGSGLFNTSTAKGGNADPITFEISYN